MFAPVNDKHMESRWNILIGNVVMSFLLIAAGIVMILVSSSSVVRICGGIVVILEALSVVRHFLRKKTGGKNDRTG